MSQQKKYISLLGKRLRRQIDDKYEKERGKKDNWGNANGVIAGKVKLYHIFKKKLL